MEIGMSIVAILLEAVSAAAIESSVCKYLAETQETSNTLGAHASPTTAKNASIPENASKRLNTNCKVLALVV